MKMEYKEHTIMTVFAHEIQEMAKKDQEMRQSGQIDPEIDKEHVERLKKIIQHIGWPTKTKVGENAAHMAWLLVQHADFDISFQRKCLEMMKKEAEKNPEEIDKEDIGYLEDRILVSEGSPQLYGTQYRIDEAGNYVPEPISDPEHLDTRRQSMNMDSFEEYNKKVQEWYNNKT